MACIKLNPLFILILCTIAATVVADDTPVGSPVKSPAEKTSQQPEPTNQAQPVKKQPSFLTQYTRSMTVPQYLAQNKSASKKLSHLSVRSGATLSFSTYMYIMMAGDRSMFKEPPMSKSVNLQPSQLINFCSKRLSDFFEVENALQENNSEQAPVVFMNIFEDQSEFETTNIDQRLFQGISHSGFYGGRKLFILRHKRSGTSYVVKVYKSDKLNSVIQNESLVSTGFSGSAPDQLNLAIREMLFYNNYVNEDDEKQKAFAKQEGCLYDSKYVYVLLEKNAEYTSLSNSTTYNSIRVTDAKIKNDIVYELAKRVESIHQTMFSHNMISPDSFLISPDFSTIKLTHFENVSVFANRPPQSLITLKGVVYTEKSPAKNTDFEAVNNDLYSLLKVFIHLDENFYPSRLSKEGHLIADDYSQTPLRSMEELYYDNQHWFIDSLLSKIQEKCLEAEQISSLQSYTQVQNSYLGTIGKAISALFSQSSVTAKKCNNNDMNSIYEDILLPTSKSFIRTSTQLVKRIEKAADGSLSANVNMSALETGLRRTYLGLKKNSPKIENSLI